MTRTDLESTLSNRLRALADYAVAHPESSFGLHSTRDTTPVRPPRRPRVPSLVAATIIVLAIAFGVFAIVRGSEPSPPRPAGVPTEPTGPAINTLTISVRNFTFQAKEFHAPAGVNEIRFVSTEGAHQLVFDDPEFSYVHLAASDTGAGVSTIKVDLVSGRRYTIAGGLPGHRAAGEEATIIVDEPSPAATPSPGA